MRLFWGKKVKIVIDRTGRGGTINNPTTYNSLTFYGINFCRLLFIGFTKSGVEGAKIND